MGGGSGQRKIGVAVTGIFRGIMANKALCYMRFIRLAGKTKERGDGNNTKEIESRHTLYVYMHHHVPHPLPVRAAILPNQCSLR
jgi:hypothetical protein